jgi:hypothetical protein
VKTDAKMEAGEGISGSQETYLEKPFTKIGLMEWLKVKALSSRSSTTKKKGR